MENVIPCCHVITYFSTANKTIFKLSRFRGVLWTLELRCVHFSSGPAAESCSQSVAMVMAAGQRHGTRWQSIRTNCKNYKNLLK
jgi:hypothetical protein